MRKALARGLPVVHGTMPVPHIRTRSALLLGPCALLLALGCGDTSPGKARAREHGDKVDSADGAIVVDTQVRRGPQYTAANVANGGTIRGTVTFADSSGIPAGNCPVPANTPRAVAWLSDIPRGNAPDDNRRVEIATGQCTIDPRIQVAITGSTVNIRNDDPYPQRFDFLRSASERPVFRAPFVFSGQLIPNERVLASPGIVEVRSDHDGLRGWIFVVDHPYAATVGGDGKFEMKDVPAGTYTMSVWTPKGIVDQKVTVAGGGVAEVGVAAK